MRIGSPPAAVATAIVATAGLALLGSGCGSSHGTGVAQLASTTTPTQSGRSSSTAAGSTQQNALASELSFSRCMRSHGVPNFPDPGADGRIPPFHSDSAAMKQATLPAQDAPQPPSLAGAPAGRFPADRDEKFAFALKVARCLRSTGFPNFPDPTVSSQGTSENLSGAGIDSNSPQFQAAETACEARARGAR